MPTSEPGPAVITGASTGFGRALATVCAEHGFDPVFVADEPQVHAAAAEAGRDGIVVTPAEVDLARSRP